MAFPIQITDLLISWRNGDEGALERLVPLVEQELHRLAHSYMRREAKGHLLQTTALINEMFLRLVDQDRIQWQNRAHFFGIAARIMRQVLLNCARDQKRLKRGGAAIHVSLSEVGAVPFEMSIELLALDEALGKLAVFDERKCRVVELRFFGGLNVEETAEVLNISPVTVARDWDFAKAWLGRELGHGS